MRGDGRKWSLFIMASSTYHPDDGSAWGLNQPSGTGVVWAKPDTGALTGAQLTTVSTDDANGVQVNSSASTENSFRIQIPIAEAVGTITQIDVKVRSFDTIWLTGDVLNTYKGNFTTSAWVLGNAYTGGGFPLTTYTNEYSITSNFSDFLDGSGNFEALLNVDVIRGGGPGIATGLEFMEVVVTWTPPSLILENVICEKVILE